MKRSILILVFVITGSLIGSITLDAQRGRGKHRDAPDETIIVLIGNPNPTFDESQFPNLRFYYMPDITIKQTTEEQRVMGVPRSTTVTTYSGSPDFIARWGSKRHLAGDDFVYLILVDIDGTVAYQRQYNASLVGSDDYNWNLLTVPRVRPDKETLEEYMRTHIRRERTARVNRRKSYTEGEEPDFRGWDDGDIEGMSLPGFMVQTSDGSEQNIKDIINGKPSIIVFSKLDPERNYASSDEAAEKLKSGEVESRQAFREAFMSAAQPDAWPMPMLWHIENVLYNYYKPRN